MRSLMSSGTKQKAKTAAKYTGYAAGGAVMLVSAVAVGLSVVNKLFEPEFLGSLGRNNVFTVAAVVGFVVMTVALIGVSIHDYKKKTSEELEQENSRFQQNNAALENNIKDLEKYTSTIEDTLRSDPDTKLSDLFKIENMKNDKGEEIKRIAIANG